LEQVTGEELGGNGLASSSWIIVAVFALVMTALFVSATATVVRERRDVVLRSGSRLQGRVCGALRSAGHTRARPPGHRPSSVDRATPPSISSGRHP
jgi:hypothetical protein